MELRTDQIALLEKIYTQDLYPLMMSTSKEEFRLIDFLLAKELIQYTDSGNTIVVSTKGIQTLAEYGIAEETVTILKVFLAVHQTRDRWNVDDLKNFCKENNYTERQVARSLHFGEGLGFLKCGYGLGSRLPFFLEITVSGEEFAQEPHFLLVNIQLDERDFKTRISDEAILEWVTQSSPSEDFEIEFKASVPQTSELRKKIATFANRASGVICLGIRDDKVILGIDNPDKAQSIVMSAISNMRNCDLRFRTLVDKEGKKVLLIMVGRGTEPVLVGKTVFIRQGGVTTTAKTNDIIQLTKEMQTTQSGHLWLKSLRRFLQ